MVPGFADLAIDRAAVGLAVTVAVDGSEVISAPPGAVPRATAELTIARASKSAAEAMYEAVQVMLEPGEPAAGKVDNGQSTTGVGPAGAVNTSVIVIPLRVTLPVFSTRKL